MTRWSKADWHRRFNEALRDRRPMQPPEHRVKLYHEQEAA